MKTFDRVLDVAFPTLIALVGYGMALAMLGALVTQPLPPVGPLVYIVAVLGLFIVFATMAVRDLVAGLRGRA